MHCHLGSPDCRLSECITLARTHTRMHALESDRKTMAIESRGITLRDIDGIDGWQRGWRAQGDPCTVALRPYPHSLGPERLSCVRHRSAPRLSE